MIYFDNSATTLQKPPQVAEALAWAVNNLGNAGRAAHSAAFSAQRAVYEARTQIASLANADSPLRVAFTSGATEGLCLLIDGLIGEKDHVITSVLEHNSVLRPLYKKGCALSFIECNENGELLLDTLPQLLLPNTRAVVCTHGSNLVGSITNAYAVQRFCSQNNLVFIMDAAQTLGSTEVKADMASYICFTGHKALFGPQGTGGVIGAQNAPRHLFKTGGTGTDSFAPHQPIKMPDMLEAGTQNAHGLYALAKGAEFVNSIGIPEITKKEQSLTSRFISGLHGISGITVYGPQGGQSRLPVVSLNINGMHGEDLSLILWEEFEIATRPGAHCAPLAHRVFKTENLGMVRFSFSYFNTENEIDTALTALEEITHRVVRR